MWNVLHFLNIPIHVQEVHRTHHSSSLVHCHASYASCTPSKVVQLSCVFPLQVCVFTAPLFSAFCALTTYFLAKEVRNQGAGLFAALFAASVPSYISRSVAGSYDNEGVAIFALVLVFFLYVKVSHHGVQRANLKL